LRVAESLRDRGVEVDLRCLARAGHAELRRLLSA